MSELGRDYLAKPQPQEETMPTISKQKPTQKKTTRRKTGGIADRIKPIGFDDDEGIKINVYGRSGTGKTTFWATFPGPILSLIVSGGNKPGELRSIDTPEYRKKISQIALEKSSDITEIIDHQKETGEFATIVLDHATGLQDMILKEILGLDELPAQLGWGIAQMQHWGQCSLQMKNYLRALLNLDCNIVIVAQEREFEGGDSDLLMPHVASALSPSVTGWLNPAVDFIVQTLVRGESKEVTRKVAGKSVTKTERTGKVEYCLRVAPHEVFTTKFRAPKGKELPEVIVDADYDKLMKLIKG